MESGSRRTRDAVLQPGDDLLELVNAYIGDDSPVATVVEGRITGP